MIYTYFQMHGACIGVGTRIEFGVGGKLDMQADGIWCRNEGSDGTYIQATRTNQNIPYQKFAAVSKSHLSFAPPDC